MRHISWHTILNNHASTRPKAYGGPVVRSSTNCKTFTRLGSSTWRCELDMANSFAAGDATRRQRGSGSGLALPRPPAPALLGLHQHPSGDESGRRRPRPPCCEADLLAPAARRQRGASSSQPMPRPPALVVQDLPELPITVLVAPPTEHTEVTTLDQAREDSMRLFLFGDDLMPGWLHGQRRAEEARLQALPASARSGRPGLAVAGAAASSSSMPGGPVRTSEPPADDACPGE